MRILDNMEDCRIQGTGKAYGQSVWRWKYFGEDCTDHHRVFISQIGQLGKKVLRYRFWRRMTGDTVIKAAF